MTIKRNVLVTALAGSLLTALSLFLWYGTSLGRGAETVRFVDVAQKAGLHYRWAIDGPRPLDILQSIGNGCAFLDYDNDGSLDILLIGTDHVALFKGDGHGHFTDVSRTMGLDKLRGHFLGCAVGDYDNDGYDDVYLSGYHTGLLLHNEQGRGFRDVTRQAGLKPQPWGTSCAFAETTPGSGRLDLYVGDYLYFNPQGEIRLCPYDTYSLACSPKMYRPALGVLYHNEGVGRFRDVTAAWGARAVPGDTLGVAFADYNGSGRPSLYLANDESPGDLLRNDGGGFTERGRPSGTALTAGQTHAGMGADWGDYDNDGRPDLAVGTFANEPKVVYHNEGGVFSETSQALGLWPESLPPLTFGVKWLDAGNSGWLDLMLVNGQVYDNVQASDPSQSYRQPTELFHNEQGHNGRGRRLVDISGRTGPDLQKPIVGRGLAVGDFDNDGRVDALVVDSEGAPLLLRNETTPAGHWLSFTLEGTRSNRDGYGAVVTVTAGGLTQTRVCHADGSYLSSSDKRVHVGLGAAIVADTVRVRWPSGRVDTFHGLHGDVAYRVREGDKEARPVAAPGTPASAR